jgi:hypothetical protein
MLIAIARGRGFEFFTHQDRIRDSEICNVA